MTQASGSLRTYYPILFLIVHGLLMADEPEVVHPITISGVARNAAGEPIAGADVYVNSVYSSAYRRIAQTKTDASGKYRFENVNLPLGNRSNSKELRGQFEVFGIAEHYGVAWRTAKYFFPQGNVLWDQPGPDPPRSYGPEDDIVLDLSFPAEAKLQGRIVDEKGQPVSGVRRSLTISTNFWNLSPAVLMRWF
ncbi:MAG: carboxypeptidase regulatory-like domain-containing protein [Planctomycetaceae bacterium]|nr:carboxypeptidase regulatory-like domain-containing protein [Planctomycetaceae bacterium]